MRIAFVSANREQLPDAVTPLGLLYVMASTPSRHERELWDLCFDSDPADRLRLELARFKPDLVAIGLRNLQTADYSGFGDNLTYYRTLVETVRACSTARVVVGGGGFSVIPQKILQYIGADFGISGEGETSFASLVEALEAGTEELSFIAGLHFFDQGKVVSTSSAGKFEDLDALPWPERGLLDPIYRREFGIESIQSKRGCPLRCDYCTYPLIEGRAIRRRDPVQFVDELVSLCSEPPEVKHVFIVDAVFNLPPRHAKDICREMIRRHTSVPWTCYANPIGFDQELADLMVAAGCAGIEVGSDSGVDSVLDRLKKGFHTEQIRRLHEYSAKAGLPDCHSLILGTNGETMDDVARSLDFCIDLDPFAAILGVWTDDLEALDDTLHAHRLRFRDEIAKLLQSRAAEFPHWVIPSSGTNFDPRLFRLLRRMGLHGPLWQHLRRTGSITSASRKRGATLGRVDRVVR